MSGSAGDVDNAMRIEGGTDGTVIGNVSDALKVVGASSAPPSNTLYLQGQLANGGSGLLNVNGSVTPVNFDWSPPASETWYLEALMFFIYDTGSTSVSNFGAIAGLTNGCELRVKTLGTEYTLRNFKNNRSIMMTFAYDATITPTAGFMESSDCYRGIWRFDQPMKLQNSTSDYIRFRVQDNLTAVDFMECWAFVWRAL